MLLRTPPFPVVVLLVALVLSGISGLVNQVIWQRALRLYLAGSESLSGMIVILVFLLGLSLGAALAARFLSRRPRVLTALAIVELLLATLNLGVFALLRSDLSASVEWLKSISDFLGLSLRWGYTLVAGLLLMPPCTLMGMTTPIAAEALQRFYAGQSSSTWLSRIFVFNTAGACLGAVLAGSYCLPVWGQSATLLIASACNCLAGLLVLTQLGREQEEVGGSALPVRVGKRQERFLEYAFLFGLVSLGYEMWLLRSLSLAWLPLPSTFAICLGLYLFCWNLGVAGSEFFPRHQSLSRMAWLVFLWAAATGLGPVWLTLDRQGSLPVVLRLLYFLPCLFSGMMYGALLTNQAKNWGEDTGAFVAWNTLGSAMGVLLGHAFGYCFSPLVFGLVQMVVLALAGLRLWLQAPSSRVPIVPVLLLFLVGYSTSLLALSANFASRTFYTSDGVVEIKNNQVLLDGLWHSAFSDPDPFGTDWAMAAVPALAHPEPAKIESCLVVGFAMGHTAEALLGLPNLRRLDGYEINTGFQQIFETFPELNRALLTDPRLHLFWEDGRSGLSLRDTSYDLITSAPLYLKQSGSSLLLSENYFRLLKRRLKRGGVVSCYARPETRLQGILVRQTFARVFPYHASVAGGYLLIGSDQPFDFHPEAVSRRLSSPGLLQAAHGRFGPTGLLEWFDKKISWSGLDAVITDDRPLVEYPHWIPKFVSKPR